MTSHPHTIPVTILICHVAESDRAATRRSLELARLSNDLKFVDSSEQCLDYLYQRGTYAGETGNAPRPGLILLDLNMPVGERHTMGVLREDPTLRTIPVVGMSSSRIDEETVRDYHLGVNTFIPMPVTFLGLLRAVSALDHYWLELVESPPVAA